MKLREGYEQVNLNDIKEIHINDKIVAVKCDGYILMTKEIDALWGHPTRDEAYFGGVWLRLPTRDAQLATNFMGTILGLVTAHRDSLLLSGMPESEYQVSALVGDKVVDIGRTSPQKFRETFDTGINFAAAIGKSGEHNKNNQSEK